ncbi:MAG: ribbon-helix-helix protein, CopG family [Verrucomicrobiae bacterium]|nr:ribbon-helix-helix protein, CopG family [Verrucomicrobiae bacterium]
MGNAVYPLPLDEHLARDVAKAAEETGLSRAELMRQALAFGLPKVVEALKRSAGRLTTVDPWPARTARALYRQEDDDHEQIRRLIGAQRFKEVD